MMGPGFTLALAFKKPLYKIYIRFKGFIYIKGFYVYGRGYINIVEIYCGLNNIKCEALYSMENMDRGGVNV